jgi:hypothetical protein
MPDERQHRKAIARAVNLALDGHVNSGFQVTLAPSVTSTTIIDARLSIQSAVHLAALTASAATALAAGSLYVVPSAGQAVIHHASNAATDQTFMATVLG